MKMDVIPAQGIFYGTVRVSNKTKGELRKGLEKMVLYGTIGKVLEPEFFRFKSSVFQVSHFFFCISNGKPLKLYLDLQKK